MAQVHLTYCCGLCLSTCKNDLEIANQILHTHKKAKRRLTLWFPRHHSPPLHSWHEEGLCFSFLPLGTSFNICTCPTSDLSFPVTCNSPTIDHHRANKGSKTQAHCSPRSPFLSSLDLIGQYLHQTSWLYFWMSPWYTFDQTIQCRQTLYV